VRKISGAKLSHLYDGLAHAFEATEFDSDYLEIVQRARATVLKGDPNGALSLYMAAADLPEATDFQKASALELATRLNRRLRHPDVSMNHLVGKGILLI